MTKSQRDRVSRIIRQARHSGKTSLLEHEAERVASEYGIKVARSEVASSEKQAILLAKKFGLPVAMKIVSQDIIHKTDVGGVKAGISSISGVRQAYGEIIRNAKKANSKANVRGVLVQEMAPKSYEFVVGGVRDPQFGPTIMFGLGGIYVELFKDVAFRLAPISTEEALSMMNEVKSSKLLKGFRGARPLDTQSAAKTIANVGRLMLEQPEVESIDINPLFIYEKGVLAVDVRIILSRAGNHSVQNS